MADKAKANPIMSYVSLVISLRQEAANLTKSNDPRDKEAAKLYLLAAANVEKSLGISSEQPPQQGTQQTQQRVSVRPEVVPNREQTLTQGGTQPGQEAPNV